MGKIFRIINNLGILRPLRQILMSADRKDKTRIYDFHNDHGHTTNECMILKGKIYDLIRNNHLLEFITKESDEEKEKKDKKAERV